MLQHIGLIIDAESAHIRVGGRAMAVAGGRCGRGRRFTMHWLLALHIRFMQQRKLTAAIALELPSRILKAAIEDAAALATGQALSAAHLQ